jgi:hypothetical protein
MSRYLAVVQPIVRHRGFLKVSSSGPGTSISLAPDVVTASSLTCSGTLATFVSATPHRFVDKQVIAVTGCLIDYYNGVYIVSVIDSTRFSYEMDLGNFGPAGGIPIAAWNTYGVSCGVLLADSGNDSAITVGPDANADHASLSPGDSYNIPTNGSLFDISSWYLKSSGASQSLRVLVL